MGDPNINPFDPLPPIIKLKDESAEERRARKALQRSHEDVLDGDIDQPAHQEEDDHPEILDCEPAKWKAFAEEGLKLKKHDAKRYAWKYAGNTWMAAVVVVEALYNRNFISVQEKDVNHIFVKLFYHSRTKDNFRKATQALSEGRVSLCGIDSCNNPEYQRIKKLVDQYFPEPVE